MLRFTKIKYPQTHYPEVTVRHRLLAPFPIYNPRESVYPLWSEKMVEMGDYYDRVWVTLGHPMRRRKILRTQDKNDAAFYWRPISRVAQRKYQKRLRFQCGYRSKTQRTLPLVPTNVDLNREFCYEEMERLDMSSDKYGSKLAPPRPKDFEFRVY